MGNRNDGNHLIPGVGPRVPYPNPIIPKLPASAAFTMLPGMHLVSDHSGRLWEGRGMGTPPFTAEELGLIGMLSQIWVSDKAMAEFGTADKGVPSIPADFFKRHPGEVMQVLAQVMQFDNPGAPHKVLASPYYNRSLVVGTSGIEELSTTVREGLGYRWPGYRGEIHYKWQWADGHFYSDIVVMGCDLAIKKAIAIAQSLRNRC